MLFSYRNTNFQVDTEYITGKTKLTNTYTLAYYLNNTSRCLVTALLSPTLNEIVILLEYVDFSSIQFGSIDATVESPVGWRDSYDNMYHKKL